MELKQRVSFVTVPYHHAHDIPARPDLRMIFLLSRMSAMHRSGLSGKASASLEGWARVGKEINQVPVLTVLHHHAGLLFTTYHLLWRRS